MAPPAKRTEKLAQSSFSHRLALVADLDVGVPDDVAQRQRALGDDGGQRGPGHRLDRAEQELRGVGQVAAQVGERARPRAAPVAPAHRGLRVAAVVRPVLRVDVERPPQFPRLDHLAGRGDARRPAEGEPDPGDDARGVHGVDHRLGVGRRRGQRLLAQHVLARGRELGDHLAVQVVGDHDADDVDVVGLDDRLPARVAALEAVPPGGVGGQLLVDVRDRHEAHGRQAGGEDGSRRAVPVRVGAARHARADDGDSDVTTHENSRSSRLFRATSSC